MELYATLALFGRFALAGVLGIAGAAKLADLKGSRSSLGQFGVPAALAPTAALLLPLAELGCAVALLGAGWAAWGAAGALALLVVFAAAIGVNLMLGRSPDCHCFGQLHSAPAGWPTLARNLVLAGAAAFVLWQGPEYAGPGAVLAGFSRTQMALAGVAVLAVVQGVAGSVVLYHLLRQNGRLLRRLDALESRAGGAPEPAPPGLPLGTPAPAFGLPDLQAATVTLDALLADGKPLLLLFSDAGCAACEAILPELGRWQKAHADVLRLVPIGRGSAAEHRRKAEPHGIRGTLLQREREVAALYRVEHTPGAVLLRDGRIASPVAVGADAIRALVEEAAAPPPLRPGDRVPALALRDLEGGTLELGALDAPRTLLLFWNPACGFCASMLEDIKAWERGRTPESPRLVVVAGGTAQANRAQGFASTVVLDADFAAGARFGAGGTPAAVIVDGDGRVASEVGVGAQAVLALAGALPGR